MAERVLGVLFFKATHQSRYLEYNMAQGPHPVKLPHVHPVYRILGTGLGASMWFFVSNTPRESSLQSWSHRIKAHPLATPLSQDRLLTYLSPTVDVQSEERRSSPTWLEASLGPLNIWIERRLGTADSKANMHRQDVEPFFRSGCT